MKRKTGQTKTVGFQFGIRRSFPVFAEEAWAFLFSEQGIEIWLGKLNQELALKEPFVTDKGIEGMIRVFKPQSHLRMAWKRRGWENTSTLQLRIISGKDKTTISFHQEKLLDEYQREEMKNHWKSVMDKLSASIKTLKE